jgi:hypothetical protein
MAVSMEVAASFLPRAVGAMVMHYAILEHWFDGMVSTIRESVEGGMSIRRHYPFNAKDEIDFLTKSFSDLPALKAYRDEMLNLLATLKPLAEMRHNVVHGALRDLDFETGVMEFSRVYKGEKNKPLRYTLTISAHELVKYGSDIHRLCGIAQGLTVRLMTEFAPEAFKKPPSGP